MELRLSARKTRRIKKEIFRGIYEENLRITGRMNPPRKKKRSRVMLPMGALLVTVTAMMVTFNLVNSQSGPVATRLPESYRNLRIQPSTPVEMEGGGAAQTTPDQYDLFLSDSSLSLRSLFGLQIKTIVIDPGHGGNDPGAVGRLGTLEKDITLDVARKLRSRLKKHPGYLIYLTRERDVTMSLDDRIEFANSRDTDLYISIHVNYLPDEPNNVIETYYFGPNTDARVLRLAERENRGGPYTLNDFTRIIEKIGDTVKTQESRLLARHIQKSMYQHIQRENRHTADFGVKTAPFTVLLGVDVPSVLSEMTCLSNGVEERKLTNETYREQIAGFLEEGIIAYLSRVNRDLQGGVEYERTSATTATR